MERANGIPRVRMRSLDMRASWLAWEKRHEQIRVRLLLLPVQEENPVVLALCVLPESALSDVPL